MFLKNMKMKLKHSIIRFVFSYESGNLIVLIKLCLHFKLTKLKGEYIKVQKKYRKYKNQSTTGANTVNDKRPKPASQANSLNSSFRSDLGANSGPNSGPMIDIDQQQMIIDLKTQLNEHKLKEMQLYHEKENLMLNIENLNQINEVSYK
jgi:hypothetical protein